ncbi:MAG: hypothetical protein D6160_04385 [Ketobacter sp.]|nr:MAG: hypothetical protein D6160_04385 [Ketobacter sp.]
MNKNNHIKPLARSILKRACYIGTTALCLASLNAHGQLLHNLTVGNPKALGLANAVTADPPGVDSIHFNPAGLAKIKGRQYSVKFIVAHTELDASFGENTEPGADVLQSYYNLRQNADCSGLPNTPDGWQNCWGNDPVANQSSSNADPSLMLPFFGPTELPILAFPSGGVAVEDPSRGWTIGTAVYSPEGFGYSRDEDDPGAYQGIQVGVTRLTYFAPTIAMPVNETLSFGVGVNFSYQGMGVDTYLRAPLETTQFLTALEDLNLPSGNLDVLRPYEPVGRLSMEMEDFLSIGFNLGILWEPYEWLSFGFLYQSEKTSQLSGDFKMENSPEFLATTDGLHHTGLDSAFLLLDGVPFNATAVESGTVELEYITPQNIAFGTSVKVLPNLKINFDVKWIEYSVWEELNFKFDGDVDFLNFSSVVYAISGLKDNADPDAMRLPRNYEDVWSVAIGAEYQVNDNLVIRAGYEPRSSAIPSTSADLLFPVGEADLFSAGFGMQLDSTSRIDGAFGLLLSEQNIGACQSNNANNCKEGDVIYNPYYSIPFKTETTAYIFALSYDKKF